MCDDGGIEENRGVNGHGAIEFQSRGVQKKEAKKVDGVWAESEQRTRSVML